jgi:hypothetical protein
MRLHDRVLRRALRLRAAAALSVCLWAFVEAPAAAQSVVTPENVTHVRTIAAHYDRSGPTHWVETKWVKSGAGAGSLEPVTADFFQDGRDASTIVLSRTEPGRRIKVELDLARLQFTESFVTTVPDAQGQLVGGVSGIAAIAEAWADCPSQAATGGRCTCDLLTLRPLQGVLGLGEVAKKRKDVVEGLAAEIDALEKDPIKIVRGLGGDYFVVDHHHGGRAFVDAGQTHGTCDILSADSPLSSDPPQFWKQLDERKWLRLADSAGNPITPDALPRTLKDLPDDPYRTLAWMVRKANGYCRALMKPAPPPFAEFLWADWMRKRPELPWAKVSAATAPALWTMKKSRREEAQKAVLAAALRLARGPQAQGLPGYRGKPDIADAECNPKGDDE